MFLQSVVRKRPRWRRHMTLWVILATAVTLIHHLTGQKPKAQTDYTLHVQSCFSESLPASIQLHCEMYHKNIITGSLCSPLCDKRIICDVSRVHGHGHKEVMTAMCQGYCHQGQSVQAYLKHDEASAADGDYRHAYAVRLNNSMPVTTDSLFRLLREHIADQSSLPQDIVLDAMWDTKLEKYLDVQSTSSHSLYNTLYFLIRQKEYVLFKAFQKSGIFPKVYGACGPLYLVESCQALLTSKNESKTVVNSRRSLPMTLQSRTQLSISTYSRGLFLTQLQTAGKHPTKYDSLARLEASYMQNGEPRNLPVYVTVNKWSSDTLTTRGNHVELQGEKRNSKSKHRAIPWVTRAAAAVKILRFLDKMEEVFSGAVHFCDPKVEHFAVSAQDGEARLIDADSLLFPRAGVAEVWAGEPSVCSDHEHCSNVGCKGWCFTDTGTCSAQRTNNNLQAVCEAVFLRPSREAGTFLRDIPLTVLPALREAVCLCAKHRVLQGGIQLQRPSADVRAMLTKVFLSEDSMSVKNSQHSDRNHDWLSILTYENCP